MVLIKKKIIRKVLFLNLIFIHTLLKAQISNEQHTSKSLDNNIKFSTSKTKKVIEIVNNILNNKMVIKGDSWLIRKYNNQEFITVQIKAGYVHLNYYKNGQTDKKMNLEKEYSNLINKISKEI